MANLLVERNCPMTTELEGAGGGMNCLSSPTGSHYWRLESPNGKSMVAAICRYCKEEKLMPASYEYDAQALYRGKLKAKAKS